MAKPLRRVLPGIVAMMLNPNYADTVMLGRVTDSLSVKHGV